MSAVFAFLGMFMLSMLVAILAAMQFADFFQVTEEFALVLVGLPVLVCTTMLIFLWTYAAASAARTFRWVALAQAAAAIAIMAILLIRRRPGGTAALSTTDIRLLLELLVPALIAILIQWGLVRRRWLLLRGEDDFSHWPWVTTVLGGLAIINPLGLEYVAYGLRQTASDRLHSPAALLPWVGAAMLVAMLLIECYIRTRMMRRRRGVFA